MRATRSGASRNTIWLRYACGKCRRQPARVTPWLAMAAAGLCLGGSAAPVGLACTDAPVPHLSEEQAIHLSEHD